MARNQQDSWQKGEGEFHLESLAFFLSYASLFGGCRLTGKLQFSPPPPGCDVEQ